MQRTLNAQNAQNIPLSLFPAKTSLRVQTPFPTPPLNLLTLINKFYALHVATLRLRVNTESVIYLHHPNCHVLLEIKLAKQERRANLLPKVAKNYLEFMNL